MAPKHRDGDNVAIIPGPWITHAHTIAAYSAFLGALICGLSLHYTKIVQNEYFGYPIEWFPSVSSTIGDRYPERAVFQVFIAITSGPRFILVFLFYCLTNRPGQSGAKWVAGVGVLRTLTCGGWTYVTSTDDHNAHDILMVSYLVTTIPWTLGCVALSPPNPRSIKYRKYLSGAFFGALVPSLYFFIQHKVHHVPGGKISGRFSSVKLRTQERTFADDLVAYTTYAFFEWSLVLLDVGFDAVTALDFRTFEIVVRDVGGMSRGDQKSVSDKIVEDNKDKPVAQVLDARFSTDEMLDAVADVYIGFTFWTVFTSLGLTVWYFPLWHMGLSGWEVAILTSLSPALLGIAPFRRHIVSAMPGSYLLMGLAALLAYTVKGPEGRLLMVGVGVWTGCLGLVGTWVRDKNDAPKLEARINAWTIGLIVSSIAKFANGSNNPMWPVMNSETGGWNKTGIVLFLLAMARMYLRKPAMAATTSPKHTQPTKGSSVLAAMGFGALVFALQTLLSDSSTMILWTWTGYPVTGPLAVPHGAWVLATMSLGLASGLFYPRLARSWAALAVGTIGAMVLTYCEDWTGFYGGLALTAYLMAVAPVLIGNAIKFPPGRTFGVAFTVHNFMLLFHIWTFAYAFVPGGPIVRERTDWVMMVTMLLLGCGVFSAVQNGTGEGGPVGVTSAEGRTFYPAANPAAKRTRGCYIYILLGLNLLTAAIAYLRFPAYNYQPYHPDSKVITAGIWTIHFSIDNDMYSSERRQEFLIRESELDLIGLLESDNQRIIMGNRDPSQLLAERLGMWVDQGPGPDKHTWGCTLLSKFPIVNSTHHLLPSPVGELAPAIHAVIDAYGELVDVYVFHSGQEEDPEDRRLQTAYMTELMGRSDRPAILLSYLVMTPGEGNYHTWVSERSGMSDIEPSDWDRWCEYILYKGLRRSGYARVSRGTVTDTELQIGKFVVGQPAGGNELVSEDQVPQDMRFPALFQGEGVRGHAYHVFEGPRYYA
ncbi:Protein cwh43 [Teratosphaeriaceae sp. CCFEE 6253]|nr:Protein cwh43 [Teratosphaeriaceae sp. CCFEE 6253]